MFRRIAPLVSALTLASVCAPPSFAQPKPLIIDSGHSFAIMSLASSANTSPPYNFGNAEVLGWVNASGRDLTKATFEFFIYPAHERSKLFDPDGNLRFDSYAELARYSFMSFKSKRARWNHDGKLELTGDFILTHVERAPTMDGNVAYNGPTYSEPDTDRLARDVTFVVQTTREDLESGLEIGQFQVSTWATIQREDFPELWPALRDSIWPTVVIDRDCQPPPFIINTRDYGGFRCSGKVVGVTPWPEPPRNSNPQFPGSVINDPPAGNEVTILVQLKVIPPH